jgi:hypothetical protein
MALGGYAGKILYVDLTSGLWEERPLDPGFAREWIGGLGFGAQIYFDLVKDRPEVEPLSPDNPFVLMTGPLTGQRLNAVARWTVGSRSPQTGLWGEANVGGYFGAELKMAGYDGIVLTGAAAEPTYLHIEDGRVELRDASAYWGLDTYQLDDRMRVESGPLRLAGEPQGPRGRADRHGRGVGRQEAQGRLRTRGCARVTRTPRGACRPAGGTGPGLRGQHHHRGTAGVRHGVAHGRGCHDGRHPHGELVQERLGPVRRTRASRLPGEAVDGNRHLLCLRRTL